MTCQQQIQQIISNLEQSYGVSFFKNLTRSLAEALATDFCFIAQVDLEQMKAETLSIHGNNGTVENFTYSLLDTPCSEVVCNDVSIYSDHVDDEFPKDFLLKKMSIKAYVGAALKNSEGQVIGILVALYHAPITNGDEKLTLFRFFAGRAAAELDRHQKELALKQLNKDLEFQVRAKSDALAQAEAIIFEREKFAALGSLVAGFTHEINTPLGVAFSSSSLLKERLKQLKNALASNKLSKTFFESCLSDLTEVDRMLEHNIGRAIHIIKNFKQISAEQSSVDKERFNLARSVDSLVQSLSAELRKHQVKIENKIPEDIYLYACIGDFHQVYSNLIFNALFHAFPKGEEGSIIFNAELDEDEELLLLSVEDNGLGISEEVQSHIFKPFYTTAKSRGGTGLGLSIVFNIVTQKLLGSINVASQVQKGSLFTISLPMKELKQAAHNDSAGI